MGLLTEKQEKFIELIVYESLSEVEAYKNAYSRSKSWSDEAIERAVLKLMADSRILDRYKKVSEEFTKKKLEKVNNDKKEVERLKEERHKELEKEATLDNDVYFTKKEIAENLKWVVDEAVSDIKENGLKQVSSSAFFNGIKLLIELEGVKADTRVKIEKTRADITKVNTEVNKMIGIAEEVEDLSDIEEEIYGDGELE